MNTSLNKKSIGHIISLKDGVGLASGLLEAQAGEFVISLYNYGFIMNLNKNTANIVFMSETNLKAGAIVYRLYQLVNISVSIFYLESVVNALALNHSLNNFLHSKLFVCLDKLNRLIELKAPGLLTRQSVYESLITGTKIIDSIIPIGLGQRELIIGDRQTGKTSIAMDAILLKN